MAWEHADFQFTSPKPTDSPVPGDAPNANPKRRAVTFKPAQFKFDTPAIPTSIKRLISTPIQAKPASVEPKTAPAPFVFVPLPSAPKITSAPAPVSQEASKVTLPVFSVPPLFPKAVAEQPLPPSDETITDAHRALLSDDNVVDGPDEVHTAPIFVESVRAHALSKTAQGTPFSQYGLLAGNVNSAPSRSSPGLGWTAQSDPRIYYNIAAPSSVFICGSQGSGKSHTLGCLLENCLMASEANTLPRPLTGLVFHYDGFISETAGSPCEAAYLSSKKGVKVRVLCSPTNTAHIKRIYSKLPNVVVEELRINEFDLNSYRMMDLMAVRATKGQSLPLYLSVIDRILRDLRIQHQATNGRFNYGMFKQKIDQADLTDAQLAPLQQRLETLESFMVQREALSYDLFRTKATANKKSATKGTTWAAERGRLTIVDLSCPCISAEMACSLFGICLSLFLEQDTSIGRVIALDEAHKFMNTSADSMTLTDKLLGTIRLQRHLGARIIISTQEPTISPRLLDLCSVTIVHRFTSPDWLATLKQHLAGASTLVDVVPGADEPGDFELIEHESSSNNISENDNGEGGESIPTKGSKYTGIHPLSVKTANVAAGLFREIVSLRTGQALMFAPNAVIGMRETGGGDDDDRKKEPTRLGPGVLKVRIRKRVTQDGGRSIMAG